MEIPLRGSFGGRAAKRKPKRTVLILASIFVYNLANASYICAQLAVLRSTAPAPLGVRKVHKIVYNISSIFNLGSALRTLAAVLLSYYIRGRVCYLG